MEEKTKEKISNRLKGQHHSKKTEFKEGHIPWSKGKVGKKYPTYKNGTGSFRKEIKLSGLDLTHCENCKREIKKINIHHIDKNKLNNDLKNLKILCTHCHSLIHNNGKNTQFKIGYKPHNFGKKFVNGGYV